MQTHLNMLAVSYHLYGNTYALSEDASLLPSRKDFLSGADTAYKSKISRARISIFWKVYSDDLPWGWQRRMFSALPGLGSGLLAA